MDKRNSRWAKLLNAQLRQPLSHCHTSLQRLALHHTGQETTSKRIASAIGITNALALNRQHREDTHIRLALRSHQRRLRALRDDSDAAAQCVGLWQVGQVARNGGQVGGVEGMGLRVGECLGFVANDVVPEGGACVHGVFEELRDEWRREGEGEDFVLGGGLVGELHDGGGADCGCK